MPTDNGAVANSIAAADKRLDNLSVLCGMLWGGLERSRRDLEEIRATVTAAQKQPEPGRAVPSEVTPDMLAG